MTSYPEVIGFARSHNVSLSDELLRFDMPTVRRIPSEIRSDGNVLVVRFPFDPNSLKKDELKKVPGASYDKLMAHWTVPLHSLEFLVDWADRFDVPVPDHLRNVIAMQKVRQAISVSLTQAVDGVRLEVPNLQATLDAHQMVGVKYLAKHPRAFNGDDLGLGKTIESIATLEFVGDQYPTLVVCPPKLALNWKREYEKFLPSVSVQVIATKAQPVKPGFDVTIIGHSIIHARQADLTGFKSLVVDEGHAFKNPGAQRTKAMVNIAKEIPGCRYNCTGTGVTTRPAEFVPQLKILDMLHHFGGEHAFYTRYCDLKETRRSKYDFSGSDNLEELNLKLRSLGYLRRLRSDTLNLPPVLHADVLVPLEAKWEKEYRKAEADIVAYLVERARQIAEEMGLPVYHAMVVARMKAEAGKHLIEIGTLRKLSAMGKIPAAQERVESMIEEGHKVIIAAHHREVVDALSETFGGLKIQGGMSVKQVEQHKKKFQETAAPVITLSMQAGSEGHTLTAADNVLFVELPWLSTVYDQTWGRAWRKGQENHVYVNALLGATTLDPIHYSNLGRRRDMVNAAIQGGSFDAAGGVVSYLLGLAQL